MSMVSGKKIVDIQQLSVMGFGEVVSKLPVIFSLRRRMKSALINFNPDVVILIDFGTFNMSMAKWCKKKGLKTAFYILPKVWAWNIHRVHKIKKYIDLPLSILPFEVDFYKQYNCKVHYVGNPLVIMHEHYVGNIHYIEDIDCEKPVIAIIPGSRRQEVERMLRIMLEAAKHLTQYHIVVSKSVNLPLSLYREVENYGGIVTESYYDLLNIAELALITSGTANVEAALFGVPQVVCYRTSSFSYAIAKRLVRVKYISLVNLICNRLVIPELIQQNCNVENCVVELKKMMEMSRDKKKELYDDFLNKIKNRGVESGAKLITKLGIS